MTCHTLFCGRTAGSHALHHYQDKVHEREGEGRGDKGRRKERRGTRVEVKGEEGGEDGEGGEKMFLMFFLFSD